MALEGDIPLQLMQNDIEHDDSASSLITGKAAERYFELNDALIQFSRLFQEENNERAAAIVGGAFLDTLLEHILFSFLAEDEKEVQRLLDADQPLGTYGSRVRVVYCLGLIGPIIRDDLRLVGKIRNRFAHDLHASFEVEPIRSWCLSLKWHELSMFMKAPEGATAGEIFQVGVNQLVTHLNGIVSIARVEKRKIRREI
jgi:hypothetical protein